MAPIEGAALLAKITSTFDYDACLLGFTSTDPDPSAEMALWMSGAPLHLWHPAQSEPATEWEARIDHLMEAQMTAVDSERRKTCFDEVQQIVSDQVPVLDLVVPHALLAYNHRVKGLRANAFSHALWNPEELYLNDGGKGPRSRP